MGTTALRQLLKSLCSNSPWKYAVLWKLRHWSSLILTWEDGYCVYPGPREPVESMSYGIYSNHASEIISSYCESNFLDGGLGGYPIGLLVANMSNLQYAWGEGVIGKVAQTGKHCWVSYDDILGKDDSRLFAQCPEEWLLQFMSGIKIIVLIPVLPYGVLQLGSLEMVPEDLAVISYVKDRFTHHTAGGNTTSLSFNRNVQAQSLSPLISSLVEKLDESSTTSTSPHKSEDSRAVDSVKPNSVRLLTSDQVVTLLDFQNPPLFTGQNLTENLVSASEPNFGSREVSPPPSQSMKASQPEMVESKLFGEDAHNRATHRDLAGGIEPSSSIKGDDAEYLLQAVVANRYSGTEDTSSNESSGVKSSIASTGHKAVTSRSPRSRMEVHPTHHAISAFVSKAKNDFNAASSPSLNSTVSTLIDGEQLQNGNHHTQPRKGTKPPNISKRRARPADSQRPRPRDRQLIQDRVKELRELVPNGAKCSIDGLLDQTIKHMLYLRSMTNQAEKLRQWVHQEVAGRKNLRSLETQDGHQKGTSWAFEIGGEMQICPIVVEDLPYPGHLLIEMLCSEQGMFLEIAQVIRSFNLTILKGVMESSENNTWAHFIVQASRGFHRLDIFWPLMQLLQRRRNPISSKISCAVR
ncbi:hypothetical protein SLE2022_104240 [Rubroshorea leprosula]